MARYDISQIKQLAIGRWPELLGLDSEILDTLHHPCPKCGGRDRFRALDDFNRTGAVICNKCFNTGNGDGIAAYAWRFDFTTGEAISSLARKLGVKPIDGNSPSASNQGVKPVNKRVKNRHEKEQPQKPKRSLAEAFKFLPWNSTLAAMFCLRKGGIEESSLVAIGAELASHSGITVVTLRIRNEIGAPIGYTAANVTGGKIAIPSTNPEQPAELTSWKNVKQKGKGIIATPNLFDSDARDGITRVYKTEGPSDLLAIIPLLNETEAAFCNPCGANENPENYPWLADRITGKQVIVIHDRDAAGVTGALGDPAKKKQGWATWAAAFAAECRNVELPYPLVDSHGKDLRDWIRDGGTRKGLLKMVDEALPVGIENLSVEVELTNNESVTVERVIELLAKRGDVYQRNSQLVQALIMPTPFGEGESMMIREIPFPAIRTLISGTCRFFSFDSDGEKRYRSVPNSIPSQVACHGAFAKVPYLIGVTEYPIMRQDGSMCCSQGYDESTKTIVRCTADLSKILPNPTRGDALQAVERLADLVCDFPFSKAEYRSAWIASLLTAVARPAIRGPVPLMLYDASSSGSGKSRLADITAIALTGRPMPRTPWPSKDEEVRKSITATLRGGQPLLCFDNCKSTLGGQSIEALGTAETWSDRILGESRNTAEISIRTTFFFTANNASLTEDASRRMCYLRIEPEDERPESRSGFKYENLLDFVEKNRGQVIADIITILSAYQRAGCPRVDSIPWGSFESWCKFVRDPLVWLNMADPRQGTLELSEATIAEDANVTLIDALIDVGMPLHGWTSREIVEAATDFDSYTSKYRNKNLRDAVLSLVEEKKLNAKILGRELKKISGKIFRGKKVFAAYDSNKKIYRWKILDILRGNEVYTGDSIGLLNKEVNDIYSSNAYIGGAPDPRIVPHTRSGTCNPSCDQKNWSEKIENGKAITHCKICKKFIGQRPITEEEFLNDF